MKLKIPSNVKKESLLDLKKDTSRAGIKGTSMARFKEKGGKFRLTKFFLRKI